MEEGKRLVVLYFEQGTANKDTLLDVFLLNRHIGVKPQPPFAPRRKYACHF